MSTGYESNHSVERLLNQFELTAEPQSVRACGRGIIFRFREPENAARALRNRLIFASGPLGILHAKQVGGVLTEYRSYTGEDKRSLHVVLGINGAVFADIDRFNPYEGPRNLLLHGLVELGPYLFRASFQWALASVAVVRNRPAQIRRRSGCRSAASGCPSISVIVPVYQEEACIGPLLDNLLELGADEIIVVDGGSMDRTAEIAARYARVLITSPGRAVQMNAGAAIAKGDVLLFLHADVRLEKGALHLIRGKMSDTGCAGGNFDVRFDADDAVARMFSWINRWRCRCGVFYGDSGIFCRREIFEQLGGYKPWPILEDYDFARRLRKSGRLSLLDEPIRVSDRRWRKDGLWRTLWAWFWIQALYLAGVSPHRLARMYRHTR